MARKASRKPDAGNFTASIGFKARIRTGCNRPNFFCGIGRAQNKPITGQVERIRGWVAGYANLEGIARHLTVDETDANDQNYSSLFVNSKYPILEGHSSCNYLRTIILGRSA